MKKKQKWLTKEEATILGLKPKQNEKGRNQSRYRMSNEQIQKLDRLRNDESVESKTSSNDYKQKFVLSAWNKSTGQMMDIDTYCDHYKLPRKDISSYKLVSHTGTPYYNIVFKENVTTDANKIELDDIFKKHIENFVPICISIPDPIKVSKDFDTLTYTDVHVGMDTNKFDNSMYPVKWDESEVLSYAAEMISNTLAEKQSNVLIVDELGDLLDGFNGKTTRGGHDLPQNMTNEEAYDCALEFKLVVLNGLASHYERIEFNNICNDNHAGAFGYFVNSAFKLIAEKAYKHVTVTNHRQFINHYYAGDTCYIITHGKDDSTLKFGFKPFLESKGMEKIDQYCKRNNIYKNASNVVFKKGDSHQALFDMCTSDDFYYFNYPALSPSSQWVQNNFKKGRRGFILESSLNGQITLKPYLK